MECKRHLGSPHQRVVRLVCPHVADRLKRRRNAHVRRMTATLVSILLVATLAGCEKYELDRQMEALCKKDGGVRVYEKVHLPMNLFDTTGRLITGPAEDVGDGLYVQEASKDLRIERRTEVIKAGEPFGKIYSAKVDCSAFERAL